MITRTSGPRTASGGLKLPIRIVVAEDNDDLRELMPLLFNEEPDIDCAATTAFLHEVAPLIARHEAHVAVLDIELRDGSVLGELPELRRQFPATQFLIHSGNSNPMLIRSVRESGAGAYVLKSGEFSELVETIRRLANASA